MGTIELKFDTGSGTFIVQNSNVNLGRGTAQSVAKFLQCHSKHFGKMMSSNGMHMVYWLEGKRIGKFKLYARSKGFEVVGPGPV